MKKRLFALCLMLALAVGLTGCIRVDTTLKVNSNKTVDVRTLFAFNTEMMPMEEGDENPAGPSQEEIDELEKQGFTYEAYSQDGFTGYTLTKKGIDINAINGNDTGLESLLDGISVKVDGNHVTVDVSALSEEEYEESGEVFGQLKSYGGYMNFNLEIPSKTTKHNATSVSKDGKTLTWDLTAMKAGDKIHAEFDLTGSSMPSWLLPVILGVLAVVIIAAVLIVLKKKKGGAVQDAVEEFQETAQNAVEDVREEAQEVVEDVRETAQDAVEDVRETAEEAVEEIREDVENKTDNE